MAYAVVLTEGAERDLESIIDYLSANGSRLAAQRLLQQVGTILDSLADLLERGSHPPELLVLGVHRYRQISFAPYRLIYGVGAGMVIVHLIADGRRDMQTLLARRLLEG